MTPTTILTACDRQQSVLQARASDGQHEVSAYTAYGHSRTKALGALGFNGELPETTGHYLLGSYRAYNPILRRFHSPDSLSPFGEGGLNPYAYCLGDPINRVDPTGGIPEWASWAAFGAGLLLGGIGGLFAGTTKFLALKMMVVLAAPKVAIPVAVTAGAVQAGSHFLGKADNTALQVAGMAFSFLSGVALGATLTVNLKSLKFKFDDYLRNRPGSLHIAGGPPPTPPTLTILPNSPSPSTPSSHLSFPSTPGSPPTYQHVILNPDKFPGVNVTNIRK